MDKKLESFSDLVYDRCQKGGKKYQLVDGWAYVSFITNFQFFLQNNANLSVLPFIIIEIVRKEAFTRILRVSTDQVTKISKVTKII